MFYDSAYDIVGEPSYALNFPAMCLFLKCRVRTCFISIASICLAIPFSGWQRCISAA